MPVSFSGCHIQLMFNPLLRGMDFAYKRMEIVILEKWIASYLLWMDLHFISIKPITKSVISHTKYEQKSLKLSSHCVCRCECQFDAEIVYLTYMLLDICTQWYILTHVFLHYITNKKLKEQCDREMNTVENRHQREKKFLKEHNMELRNIVWVLKVSAAYMHLTLLLFWVLLFLAYRRTIWMKTFQPAQYFYIWIWGYLGPKTGFMILEKGTLSHLARMSLWLDLIQPIVHNQ